MSMTDRRCHLVDGTYELFRSFYSKRPSHLLSDGQDIKATVGVLSSLLSLLHDSQENVTHLACAFDNPIRSFRNELFQGYKTEEGVPEALLSQFGLVEEAVAALGITVWSMRDFEADDALATGARQLTQSFDEVLLLSPDKDLGQCLVQGKVVQVDRRQQKRIDEAALKQKFGFGPSSVPDFLALVGDAADGIPGLAGFGEKTAAALLSEYPHLENIPKEASQWRVKVRGAPQLAQTLSEGFEDVLLYRTLARLRTNVPLDCSAGRLAWKGLPLERFSALCDRLSLRTLKERYGARTPRPA
jgi:5'-3' exonuclease